MIVMANIIRMSSGGFLPLLGLFTVLQIGGVVSAAEQTKEGTVKLPCDIPTGQTAMQAEQDAMRKSHLISGEVIRMDGATFVVKGKNGKEVSLHVDEGTNKPAIEKGNYITASVDAKNHALWIRSNESTDRRTEHAAVDCNPTEEVSSEALKQFGKTSEKKR